MSDANLTQSEADGLLAMEKHRADQEQRPFPGLGQVVQIPLLSADRREAFVLDLSRGRVDLAKVTYQNRAQKMVVLVRLDLAGSPHRNPDGEEVPCPHLHVYREGWGDKWAYPPEAVRFPDLSDEWAALDAFMSYCNITKMPLIERTLFA